MVGEIRTGVGEGGRQRQRQSNSLQGRAREGSGSLGLFRSFQPRASSLTFNVSYCNLRSIPGKAKVGFVRFRSWRHTGTTASVWGLSCGDSLSALSPSMPLADDRKAAERGAAPHAACERHTVRYDDVSPQLLMHSMHIIQKDERNMFCRMRLARSLPGDTETHVARIHRA